jgi:ATP-binding cassette subfamily B protein
MYETWKTVRRVAGYFPRVLKLIWDSSPRYASLTIFLTIVSAAALPAQIWISKVIIDRITEAIQASSSGNPLNWHAILAPVGVIALVWVLGGISLSLSQSVRALLAFQAQNHLSYLILRKASRLDIAFYETPAFYDQMANAQRDIWRIQNLAYVSVELLGGILTLSMVTGMLFRLHPLAVAVLLLTSVPMVVVGGYYANRRYDLHMGQTSAQRMVSYFSGLLGSRDTVKEIRLFSLHGPFLERFRHFWQKFFDEDRRLQFSEEKTSLLLGLLSTAGRAAIWVYAVVQAVSMRITIGDVALVFQAVDQSWQGVSHLFSRGRAFYENSLFAGNLFSFLGLKPDAVEGALSRGERYNGPSVMVPKSIRHGIEFRNVSFHYPRSERCVLRNLSFTLSSGETVALVGENGAGKTTLVKLLTRLYDPTDGAILLDGRDLREYDLDDLRRQIGVIFQDFVRYQLSARENIGFGQVEFVEDRERVVRAADRGGARSLVENLPRGFETILGRTFDEGVDLSGGEWQKLALSRAFMREAQILILDEPTAALDALAEYEVYRRFTELAAGKTTIFISHRFSTVRIAQHILVLHEGRLIEEGTHETLMALDGQYAKMFNTQAERYQ